MPPRSRNINAYIAAGIDTAAMERVRETHTPKKLATSIDVDGAYWTPNPSRSQIRASGQKVIRNDQTNFAGELEKNVVFFDNVQRDATNRMTNGLTRALGRKNVSLG